MNWVEVLEASPSCKITLPGDELSFAELALAIKSLKITGPIIWKPEWTRNSLAELLAALDSIWTVIVDNGKKLPEITSREQGLFFISSSGTEGPSRFISHEKHILEELKPRYEKKTAAALLKPGHAAGIEFFLAGLKGKNHLRMCSGAKELAGGSIDILHGPPSLLAYLLSFPSVYKSFLDNLTYFYNGTEALPSVLVTKVREAGMKFSIEQIYGTTETWSLKTITHEEKPWLIKFTDPDVEIVDGKIMYKKWFTGDLWKEVEPGWGIIESQRHWTATMMGEKINLFDLENVIMKQTGVVDIEASAVPGAMGVEIHLKIFAAPEDHERLKQELNSVNYQMEFFSPDKMNFQKKKRTVGKE